MDEQDQATEPGISTTVSAHTAWWIVTGIFRSAVPIRLSDYMNNEENAFLPLERARAIRLRDGLVGPVSGSEPLLISRQEILLLYEVPTRGAQAKQEGRREEMRVQKRVVSVQVLVGPFWLRGTLHLPQYGELEACLSRGAETFLALTAVSLDPAVPGYEESVRIPFALVNWKHLTICNVEDT